MISQAKPGKVKIPLQVSSVMDLSKYPQAPSERHDDAILHRCLFNNGQVSIKARTDRIAYVSGEVLTIHASFTNGTSLKMMPKVTLIQRQLLVTRGGRHKTNNTNFTLERSGDSCNCVGKVVRKKSQLVWNGENFLIPDDVASSFDCQVLRVCYFVEIALSTKTRSGSTPVTVLLPIVLGPSAREKSDMSQSQISSISNLPSSSSQSSFNQIQNQQQMHQQQQHQLSLPPSYQETIRAIGDFNISTTTSSNLEETTC